MKIRRPRPAIWYHPLFFSSPGVSSFRTLLFTNHICKTRSHYTKFLLTAGNFFAIISGVFSACEIKKTCLPVPCGSKTAGSLRRQASYLFSYMVMGRKQRTYELCFALFVLKSLPIPFSHIYFSFLPHSPQKTSSSATGLPHPGHTDGETSEENAL